MANTFFLAQLLGLSFAIVALAGLFRRDMMVALVNDIVKKPELLFVFGVFDLVVGLSIVLSHNVWDGWEMLITIIGWLALLKGVLRMFMPDSIVKLAKPLMKKGSAFNLAMIVTLLVGLFLCYQGFIA